MFTAHKISLSFKDRAGDPGLFEETTANPFQAIKPSTAKPNKPDNMPRFEEEDIVFSDEDEAADSLSAGTSRLRKNIHIELNFRTKAFNKANM